MKRNKISNHKKLALVELFLFDFINSIRIKTTCFARSTAV